MVVAPRKETLHRRVQREPDLISPSLLMCDTTVVLSDARRTVFPWQSGSNFLRARTAFISR